MIQRDFDGWPTTGWSLVSSWVRWFLCLQMGYNPKHEQKMTMLYYFIWHKIDKASHFVVLFGVLYFQPNPCQQKGNLRKCPTWAFLCPYWNRPHYVWLPISGRFLARKLVSPTGHKRCSQAEQYLAVESCFPVLPWIPIPARFWENPGNGTHLDVGPNIFLPTRWSFILAVPICSNLAQESSKLGSKWLLEHWATLKARDSHFKNDLFSSVFTNPDLELG
jgi:hypothetical protein